MKRAEKCCEIRVETLQGTAEKECVKTTKLKMHSSFLTFFSRFLMIKS